MHNNVTLYIVGSSVMAKWECSPEIKLQIYLMYLSGEISRFGVAGGDGGVAPQQQVMHRSAYNLTAANHHSSLPGHRHTWNRPIKVNG